MRRALILATIILAPVAGWTQQESVQALMTAASRGETAQLQKLLDDGVDVNVTDSHGFSALIPAIEALLTRGAQINARADDGSTALGFAEMKGRSDAARYLEQHGALR